MATDINLSECTSNFTTKKRYEFPTRLCYLRGTLTHPSLGKLASIRCLQIQHRGRFKLAGDFLEVMDAISRELHQFSVDLFDKNSIVRPWLVDGGAKCGSGCWSKELNSGDMIYIEDLEVKKEFRRRGVGSWLLQKLLTSSHIGPKDHVICWPTPNGFTADDKAGQLKEVDIITAFYRKNGFRRIGLSQFLAYSPDPSHPSRNLPISSDPETPSRDFEAANPNTPDLKAYEIQTQYPLHCAIATNKTPSIAEVIHVAHWANPGSVRRRDPDGYTPVHGAAACENVHALRALLSIDPDGISEDLKSEKSEKNRDGMTPLESLKASMRSTREFQETLLHKWDGYDDAGLRCEYIVHKALGDLPGLDAGEEMYVKKKKYGCSCGMCTDGWLSLRMRFRLSVQAAIQQNILHGDLELFEFHNPLSASVLLHRALDYLPLTLQDEICKTFYIGFYTIFHAIRDILLTPRTPTPQAILLEALALDAGAVQFYLDKGGKVEYALDATAAIARGQSSLGDGMFEETFDREGLKAEGVKVYKNVGECLNDLEFGLVRRKLGLSPRVEWGPYKDRGSEEEGMEVDEDDEDDEDEDDED